MRPILATFNRTNGQTAANKALNIINATDRYEKLKKAVEDTCGREFIDKFLNEHFPIAPEYSTDKNKY